MHEFCARAAQLPAEKRILLARQLRTQGPRPLGRTVGPNVFELSPAQERLWFLDRLAPRHPVHNVCGAVRLRGKLDEAALRRCLRLLVERHESLRTIFSFVDGRPVQVVLPTMPAAMSSVDLRGEPAAARARRARELVDATAREGFEIDSGPLLRALLIRTDVREHVLLLVLHHLVSDGFSVSVMVREIASDYGAVAAGRAPAAKRSSIQYADYAVWQRYSLAGPDLERLRAHWAGALMALPTDLTIRSDRPPPQRPSFDGAVVSRLLPTSVTTRIECVKHAEKATLFVALAAAFNELLRSRGAGDDVTLLMSVANRVRPEARDLVGFLVNLVPLRTRFDGEASFREIVGRVRRSVLSSLAHAELPFPAILSVLNIGRSLQRPPISGFGLLVDREVEAGALHGDIELTAFPVDTGTARTDLTVSATESGRGLTLRIEYATDLFDRPTAESMLSDLEEILHRGCAASPCERCEPDALLAQSATGSVVAGASPSGDSTDDIAQPSKPGPEQLAYVIYTSGSSGAPKGAMIEHRGLSNHLRAKIDLLGLEATDCVAQTAPQTFDISIWQMLAPLLCGARVRIVPEGIVRVPHRLRAEVATGNVTVLELVPSLLREWLRDADRAKASAEAGRSDGARDGDALRWLIVTGDVVSPSLCREWLQARPEVPIVNAYGPTECADDVAHHVMRSEADTNCQRIPIGRTIANTQLFVLNEMQFPVPAGVAGEICVAGVAVGRGYLQDAAATDAAFVPSPFPSASGARLYRSADRGRFRPDGTLEFLGRMDDQVKVRGVRIEPGEIEAAIARHPAVGAAAVTANLDGAERSLVAYLAPRAGCTVNVDAIRDFVRDELPVAMVPGTWVLLDELPRSVNGKVDRRTLPDAGAVDVASSRAIVAPRTPSEETLVRVARELLRRVDVGVEDDFFALGGDSILCVELAARLREAGLMLAIEDFFEAPRLADLALRARPLAHEDVCQRPIDGAIGLTPIQRAFFAQVEHEPHHFNQSLFIAAPPGLDPVVVEAAWRRVLAHHDALRSYFLRNAESWAAFCAGPDLPVPLRHFDLSSQTADEQRCRMEAVAAELQTSFALGVPPLLRVATFDLGRDRQSRILVILHHLVVDAASWRVLLTDLHSCIVQLSLHAAPTLPRKTASVRDLNQWYEQSAARDVQSEVEFWAEQCREPVVPLPLDFAGGENGASQARQLEIDLGAADTRSLLRSVAPRHRMSTAEVLLAALGLALARWIRRGSPFVFVETSGRQHLSSRLDVSRTVGWLTAVFPIRIALEPDSSPLEALALVRSAWRGIPCGGLRYAALRFTSDTALRGRMERLPIPQVSLNYIGALMEVPAGLDGLSGAGERVGAEVGGRIRRPTLIDVEARVEAGRLRLVFSYAETRHRRTTIHGLAESTAEILVELVRCSPREERPDSRSDDRNELRDDRCDEHCIDAAVGPSSNSLAGRRLGSRFDA